MTDQERVDLILSQAKIAKAAVAAELLQPFDGKAQGLRQALLAIEAILALTDPKIHVVSRPHSNAA